MDKEKRMEDYSRCDKMKMNEEEKRKIIECSLFLADKGYMKNVGISTITYSHDGIAFIITFEPNSDISDVFIKFIAENEVFSVGWIACVRNGLQINPYQRLENVLMLLSYIRKNYNTIVEINYCRESNSLISEFIAKKKNNP